MLTKPKIAVIINSFNRFELLKECLETLTRSISSAGKTNEFLIVVFDAGSNDGSYQWLKTEGCKLGAPLDIIQPGPEEDTSFSSGINTAVAYAESKYESLEYFLFYETDNQILNFDPIYWAIYHLLAKDDLAACGFTVRHHNGRPAGVGQPFPSLFNFFLGKNIVTLLDLEAIPYDWETNDQGIKFSQVDVVYTSPLIVKKEAWQQSGGLNWEIFPFSDCDVDWARRLRDLGWKMGVIETKEVIHDNRNSLSTWSKNRAMHSHRGRLNYFKRHHPIAVFLIWPWLLPIRHILECISSRFIKNPNRRKQLSIQYYNLLKTSIRGYQ